MAKAYLFVKGAVLIANYGRVVVAVLFVKLDGTGQPPSCLHTLEQSCLLISKDDGHGHCHGPLWDSSYSQDRGAWLHNYRRVASVCGADSVVTITSGNEKMGPCKYNFLLSLFRSL